MGGQEDGAVALIHLSPLGVMAVAVRQERVGVEEEDTAVEEVVLL